MSAFQHATPLPSPYIPYLHTNGAQTHPLIVILNAIITHKRVLFISQKQGSNLTARMILAACAMASGCGQVLRGITAHAYPTAGLWDMDTFESSVAYIAGVTNPQLVVLTRAYDVVADIDEGKISISPHFREGLPPPAVRSSSLSSGASDDYEPPSATTITPEMEKPSPSRADCVDNAFIEDVSAKSAFRLMRQLTVDCPSSAAQVWRVTDPLAIHRLHGTLREPRRGV